MPPPCRKDGFYGLHTPWAPFGRTYFYSKPTCALDIIAPRKVWSKFDSLSRTDAFSSREVDMQSIAHDLSIPRRLVKSIAEGLCLFLHLSNDLSVRDYVWRCY